MTGELVGLLYFAAVNNWLKAGDLEVYKFLGTFSSFASRLQAEQLQAFFVRPERTEGYLVMAKPIQTDLGTTWRVSQTYRYTNARKEINIIEIKLKPIPIFF